MHQTHTGIRKAAALLLAALLLLGLGGCDMLQVQLGGEGSTAGGGPFRLLISDDNQDLEGLVAQFAQQDAGKPQIDVTVESIARIKGILEAGSPAYDAVWVSSSVHLQTLSGGLTPSRSRFTAISPVVFAVRESKAKALGLEDDLVVDDILNAVRTGELTFLMPGVSQTNSGLSAYLGILSALSGSPQVLTVDLLQDEDLRENLTALFSGVERSSGSDAFIAELVLAQDYDCIVAAEYTVIQLNRELEAAGREPMRLLYPRDGVTIADMPLAYLDQGDGAKLATFLALQDYVLGEAGQAYLLQTGRRTDLGGLIQPESGDIFRADWGIDPDAYLYAIVYPSKAFLEQAMTLYQELLRKPAYTVFCLDFSGSMYGQGHRELMEAMRYILSPERAGEEYLQFTGRDQLILLPFDAEILAEFSGAGDQSPDLLAELEEQEPMGGTDIYLAVMTALDRLTGIDTGRYTLSVVLMTDGESMRTQDQELRRLYETGRMNIPVYSIMFGQANPTQLEDIAAWTAGKVFDGRTDLLRAFQEVRGYN